MPSVAVSFVLRSVSQGFDDEQEKAGEDIMDHVGVVFSFATGVSVEDLFSEAYGE